MNPTAQMNESVTVTIESEDEDVPEPSYIRHIVQLVCDMMGLSATQVNVQIVDQATIRELNQQYRNIDKSTNVLSFSSDLPVWVTSEFRGDVVVCPAVIREEANLYNKSLKSRWAHMLVHGTLHLLGMSHEDELNQTKMENMELDVMTRLGFDDPYLGENQ